MLRTAVCVLLVASIATGPASVMAQAPAATAGEIESAQGVGFVQSAGQPPRSLSKGMVLQEGDRVSTASNGSAILALKDGSRMTVRPESDIVLTQFRFNSGGSDNSMILNMLRGGLRALTGLVSKNSPNAARITTPTVSVGIRGTDFDVRLCQSDCATESRAVGGQARAVDISASARVILLSGEANATSPSGQRRRLSNGAAIYPEDLVETGPDSHAVLAFRDDSRVTMGASSRFRIDQFAFDSSQPQQGRFLVSLIKGTLRALTGLIGKANNRNVTFTTATVSVGIRGTGLDLVCSGGCAGEQEAPGQGFSALTWQGSIDVTPVGQNESQILAVGQGLFIDASGIRPITGIGIELGPRPDTVTVPANLFSLSTVQDVESGVYVYVRDGHIEVTSQDGVLQLGRNEVAFAGPDGQLQRAAHLPRFIEFDRVPHPATRQFGIRGLLSGAGLGDEQICR